MTDSQGQNVSEDNSTVGNEQVPADFPESLPRPFSLGGVQLKVNLVKSLDGMFYEGGSEPEYRLHRHRECLLEVDWAVELLATKLPKPKYQALQRGEILKMLGVNLIRDRGLTTLEADWVLVRVASRTSWPIQSDPIQ